MLSVNGSYVSSGMEVKVKKEGVFQMRRDPDLERMVDDWRGNQRPIPSRAEAFRSLVRIGIAAESGRAVGDAAA